MKKNYELHELNEFRCVNFAAKAANAYEYSYPFATKSQNSIRQKFVKFVKFVVKKKEILKSEILKY